MKTSELIPITDQIINQIITLQAARDNDEASENDLNNLKILEVCYELLARTSDLSSIIVEDSDISDEPFSKYSSAANKNIDAFFEKIISGEIRL